MAEDQKDGGDGQQGDGQDGGAETFTKADVEAAVTEALAKVKGEKDTAFQKLWNEAKAAKAKLKELEQEGKAQKAGVTSDELKRMREEVLADLKAEYAPLQEQLEAATRENRALKLDNVVKQAMGKAGVRAARVDALFRLTADQFDLTDDGQPMLKARPGTPLEKYLKDDLVKEYPEFYEGSGSSGGGAAKSSAGGGGGRRTIAAGDDAAFLANLEGVATGKVEVR